MIQALSYIGFTSPDYQQWATFGPDVLGLQVAEPDGDGALRLRSDDAPWRIAIHPGDTNDVAYLGWSVAGPENLAAIAARLSARGVVVHVDDALAQARGVDGAAWFIDPFGFRHELVHGIPAAAEAFVPGRAGVSFVTGDQGLGHGVLIVPDFEAATEFFVDVLGFRISDDIEDGITVRFLHCNARHHSLAFTAVPGLRGFHHLMLEVADPQTVESAWKLVQNCGLPVAMTLGRHTNDEMYSFYVRGPSGFEIEYGSGGKTIDTSSPWPPGHYDAMSSSGHYRPDDAPVPGIVHAAVGAAL
ncbi:VOC family protein [Mycobacterium vicinigordonae]|uniref:VOC family protein n=1 Tax=Mycobacterium vicinigordonae TaxID=1719132 RepID=A0A7D6I7D9_9MYCO|nr:VOC family protein [Mycobacterium vicinigordonae]QLL07536.1 VOC family protein [Mycobacterium vicinigordonae]